MIHKTKFISLEHFQYFPLQCFCLGNPMDKGAWWATRPPGARVKAALTLAPSWKQECFKKRKTVKKGANFTIRDIAQCMGDHAGKQFVYPTQKQGREAPPERKGMGIISNEEECSSSETRQRHTPWKEGGVSWVRKSALWRCVNHAYRTVLLGLFYLWPIVLFLPSTWLVPGSSSRGVHIFFLRWIPPQRCPLITGWGPLPFQPPRISCTCADRDVFLDLRSGHLPVSWL